MNSLLITNTYLPRIGGRENYYHHLFSRLERGRVLIVTPDRMRGYGAFDREYGLDVLRVDEESSTWFLRGRRARAKWLWNLASICWRYRIDVVHCGVILPDGLFGWLLRETLGIPYIAYTFGREILEHQRHPYAAAWMQIALASASRVVYISRYTAEMLKELGVAPEKLVKISPGVDAKRFNASSSLDRVEALRQLHGLSDRPVILTVARLVDRKGIDKVIESLPLILRRFPNAVYLVVGDGSDRSRLERLRDSLGLGNNVIFTGFVPEEDLLAYYRLATLFAMVSRQPEGSCEVEGFGIVYLEANACGLPVVAGDSGGVSDAVVDGKTGYLVDPLDVDGIAAAIIRLLGDPELRDRLGGFGRARVVEEFSWEQLSRRLEQLTEEVGAEMPRRSPIRVAAQSLPLLLRRHAF